VDKQAESGLPSLESEKLEKSQDEKESKLFLKIKLHLTAR
jgi:hypothetical protein